MFGQTPHPSLTISLTPVHAKRSARCHQCSADAFAQQYGQLRPLSLLRSAPEGQTDFCTPACEARV